MLHYSILITKTKTGYKLELWRESGRIILGTFQSKMIKRCYTRKLSKLEIKCQNLVNRYKAKIYTSPEIMAYLQGK